MILDVIEQWAAVIFSRSHQPMKGLLMEALRALILTETQLRDMLVEAAKEGAARAISVLQAQLQQSPDEATVQKLRTYLADPATMSNAHDLWAHSGIIRQLNVTARGKPKSAAWFMKFQRESGLAECFSRPSPAYGRRREWSFHDIRLALNAYYRRR